VSVGEITGAVAVAEHGGAIDYFNPSPEIDGRAAEILTGFPTPTGDTSKSPLDFEQLDQLRVAAGHRKALLRFKALCSVLTLATLCIAVIPLSLVVVGMYTRMPAVFRLGFASRIIFITLGVSVGLMVIYQAASAAAHKAKSWGPLVVLGLILVGVIPGVARAVMMPRLVFGTMTTTILFGVTCVAWVLFISICVRAVRAASGFVKSPVWCQEALVYSKF
jgi:hypothetical protein